MKNGRSDKRIRNTSKFISLILRHRPEVIGISLDEHGWADVQDLIGGVNHAGGHFLDQEILEMTEDGFLFHVSANKVWLIKAVPAEYLSKMG